MPAACDCNLAGIFMAHTPRINTILRCKACKLGVALASFIGRMAAVVRCGRAGIYARVNTQRGLGGGVSRCPPLEREPRPRLARNFSSAAARACSRLCQWGFSVSPLSRGGNPVC